MRIVGFRAANNASTQYRTKHWIKAMKQLGHDAECYGSPYADANSPKDTDARLALFDQRVNGADVVIYGLTVDAHEIAVLQAGRDTHGYRLIIDTDDLVTEVPIYNQASSWYHNATGLIRIAEAQYRSADAVTVSTEPLRKAMEHYNARTVHVPNLVDPDLYEGVRTREKEARHTDDIRIYWGGGGGHYDDLLIVKDALLRVCAERPNVKLVFGNLVPGWAMDLPSDRVFYTRLTEFSIFRKLLSWLCIDIGIAPLVNNRFNQCKSHVKYLDYAMVGIAGVYSDIESYDAVLDNVTGLKAGADEWYTQIMRLVDDWQLRRELGRNAKAHVLKELTVDTQARRYEAFLKEVVETKARPPLIAKELDEGVPINVNSSCSV